MLSLDWDSLGQQEFSFTDYEDMLGIITFVVDCLIPNQGHFS